MCELYILQSTESSPGAGNSIPHIGKEHQRGVVDPEAAVSMLTTD